MKQKIIIIAAFLLIIGSWDAMPPTGRFAESPLQGNHRGLPLLTAAIAHANTTDLPDFNVTTMENEAVGPSNLPPSDGRWLLIYVSRDRSSNDIIALLSEMEKERRAQSSKLKVSERAIIIVQGKTEDAKMSLNKYPLLSQFKWYADANSEALKNLTIKGAPVLFGIETIGARGEGTAALNRIIWRMDGLKRDKGEMKRIIENWIERQ